MQVEQVLLRVLVLLLVWLAVFGALWVELGRLDGPVKAPGGIKGARRCKSVARQQDARSLDLLAFSFRRPKDRLGAAAGERARKVAGFGWLATGAKEEPPMDGPRFGRRK